MKLSNVLKVFSAAALIGSLVPYRVTKDEETGEKKYRALLWEVTQTPQSDGSEKNISLQVGFFSPMGDHEAHMYADDLAVEYTPDDEEMEVTIQEPEAAEDEAEAEEVEAEETAEAEAAAEEETTDDSAE